MGYFLLVLAFLATLFGIGKDVLGKQYASWIAGAALLIAALALGFGIAAIKEDNLAKTKATAAQGKLQQSLDEMTTKANGLETQIEKASATGETERLELQKSLDEMTTKAAGLAEQVNAGNTARQNDVTLRSCKALFTPIKELSDALYSIQMDKKYEAPNFTYQKFYHQNFKAFNSGNQDWDAFRALGKSSKDLMQGEIKAIYNRSGADFAVKRRKEIVAEIKTNGCSLKWNNRGFTVALSGT